MTLGGLCALARFDGAPPDPATVERMAGAVAWRRAGGVEIAREPAAVLASLTPGGGPGAERGIARSGLLAVAADARLVRRPELLHELDLPQDGPTDAELILAAYLRWGEDCPDHLLGEFAFALWDGERRTLLCVRDPVGARPLRYLAKGPPGSARVASSPWQLLAAGDVSRAVDRFALADRLAGNFYDLVPTPFAAVRNLTPGCCIAFGPEGRREWRYWNPERAEGPGAKSEGEWIEAFRALLFRVVLDHLGDAEGAAALMTSGGLDSSTVAAIARELEIRGTLATRPIAFVHTFERLRACDEWRWASALAEETGIAVERIASDDLSNLAPDPGLRDPPDDPVGLAGEITAGALERTKELGCTVVTTGYGGDTLFDAARWRYIDLVRAGRWAAAWPWVAGARTRGVSWPRALGAVYLPPLLGRRGRRALDRLRGADRYWRSPPWLRAEYGEAAEERRSRPRHPRVFGSRARQDQYEHLVGLAQQGPAIDFWSAMGARHGIEARFPLLDRRLAELVLAAPLALGARPGPGGSKHLLRRATEGVLPEAIRRRPDKGSWAELTRDSICRRFRDEIGTRFTDSRLSGLGLIDDGELRAGLDAFCAGRAPASYGTLLAAAYLTETWLRVAESEIGA